MPLPPMTRIKLEKDSAQTVKNIQISLERLRQGFANASGEAIDSSGDGGGGGGAITIIDPPTAEYAPGVMATSSGNKTVVGFVDVTFSLPDKATQALIRYRQVGTTEYKQSVATTSPYKVTSLNPDTQYDMAVAGIASNGAVGPYSSETVVAIPAGSPNVAPANGPYVVTATNADLPDNYVLHPEDTVTTVDVQPGNVTVGIAQSGVKTEKIADAAVVTAKVSDAAITTPKLGDAAVTTPKIADAAVTLAKLADYVIGSFVMTINGYDAPQTATVQYLRMGRLVTLMFPVVTGTSNVNTFSASGNPYPPATLYFTSAIGVDNAVTAAKWILVNSSGLLNFRNTASSNVSWTPSGTKGMNAFAITYIMA